MTPQPTLLHAAAGLVVLVVLAHSWLGERFILIRLFRREDLPRILGGADFTKRTLRMAWHVTSLLGLGLACLLVAMAAPGGASKHVAGGIIAATFAASGLLSLVLCRGRHLSWIAFFAIAALTWFAV
jgi:hypothetical protein